MKINKIYRNARKKFGVCHGFLNMKNGVFTHNTRLSAMLADDAPNCIPTGVSILGEEKIQDCAFGCDPKDHGFIFITGSLK
jgi:hypothetical protein